MAGNESGGPEADGRAVGEVSPGTGVRDVMGLMRDHFEGTPLDLHQGVGAGEAAQRRIGSPAGEEGPGAGHREHAAGEGEAAPDARATPVPHNSMFASKTI